MKYNIFLAIFAPSASSFMALRFILLFMSIAMILLLLKPSDYRYGALIFLSVPILVFGIQGLSIESFRLPLFSGGIFLLLWDKSDEWSLRSFIRHLIAFAMITAPHSLGLLLGLLTLCSLFIVNKSIRHSFFQILAFLFSILVFTPQYIINLVKFGTPVQDSTPVLDSPVIAFYSDLRIRRELDSTYGIFVNGALRPFTDFGLFGFIFLIGFVLAIIFLLKERSNLREFQLQSISALIVFMFMALQVISALLGYELLIKNVRYALSIFPCLLVIIAHELGKKQNV